MTQPPADDAAAAMEAAQLVARLQEPRFWRRLEAAMADPALPEGPGAFAELARRLDVPETVMIALTVGVAQGRAALCREADAITCNQAGDLVLRLSGEVITVRLDAQRLGELGHQALAAAAALGGPSRRQ